MSDRKAALNVFLAIAAVLWSSVFLRGMQAKPDLRVTELLVDKVQSENVPLRLRVAVAIKNFGATTPSGFTVRLYYKTKSGDPYVALFDFHSGIRQANGGDRWEKTFDFQEGGTYYFKAEADPENQIPESAEGNNTKTLAKSFTAGTPDLAVANLAAKFVSVTPTGAHARIDWDVENIGDGKAVGTFVTVLRVSKNGANFAELARFSRTSLDKGKSFHFFKDITYSDVRSLRFMVVTDATNVIHERGQTNNTAYTQTIKP
jgi:hypothetical protein